MGTIETGPDRFFFRDNNTSLGVGEHINNISRTCHSRLVVAESSLVMCLVIMLVTLSLTNSAYHHTRMVISCAEPAYLKTHSGRREAAVSTSSGSRNVSKIYTPGQCTLHSSPSPMTANSHMRPQAVLDDRFQLLHTRYLDSYFLLCVLSNIYLKTSCTHYHLYCPFRSQTGSRLDSRATELQRLGEKWWKNLIISDNQDET